MNPYLLQPPVLISFSGGRTSGYMLGHILEAFGGKLPPGIHVSFANTGKEMPQTLEFVAEIGERWRVKIDWLEFDPKAPNKTKRVSFTTASRTGEPFEELIRAKNFLPNPVTRHCTSELKVKRFISLMRDTYGYKHWDNAVGLRADEQRRVSKQRARNDQGKERFDTVMPLAEAGVTKEMVVEWWEKQNFNLRLVNVDGKTPYGNCDLCFMKGAPQILDMIRERPELVDWWVKMETVVNKPQGKNAATFRIDRPTYAKMAKAVKDQMVFDFPNFDEAIPCYCTD